MRAHSPIIVGGIATLLLGLALGLAGCGSESSDTNTPTATAGTSGAQVEVGNTINYGSFGTTADIDCADGKSLNVGGSNNTLTVKGEKSPRLWTWTTTELGGVTTSERDVCASDWLGP